VLIFDPLPGLFIGITVSLLLLYRASRPHVAVLGQVPGMPGQYGDLQRHPENEQAPGIVLPRVEGGLFFANADTVRDAVRTHAARPGTCGGPGVELVIARDVGQVAVAAVAGPEPPGTG
jgi:SulP family sulfate permease